MSSARILALGGLISSGLLTLSAIPGWQVMAPLAGAVMFAANVAVLCVKDKKPR